MTDLERFMSKVEKTDTCWLWIAGCTTAGYGNFYVDNGSGALRRPIYAHRWSYEHFVGPIPEGLTIDHVKARGCTHKNCVNPAHLEAVTNVENIMRSDTITAVRARSTHCSHGHEFTPTNTYVTSAGHRQCKTCNRERSSRYYHERKSA